MSCSTGSRLARAVEMSTSRLRQVGGRKDGCGEEVGGSEGRNEVKEVKKIKEAGKIEVKAATLTRVPLGWQRRRSPSEQASARISC